MADVVKYRVGSARFEVLTKPGTLEQFKAGKIGAPETLFLGQPAIFVGRHHRAQKAEAADLTSAFGTSDEGECVKRILSSGKIVDPVEEARVRPRAPFPLFSRAPGQEGEETSFIDTNYWDFPLQKVL